MEGSTISMRQLIMQAAPSIEEVTTSIPRDDNTQTAKKLEPVTNDQPKAKITQSEVFSDKNLSDLNDLSIKQIKINKKTTMELPNHHKNIIRPHFFIGIVAGVKSGKTYLLANLVYRKAFYAGVFDKKYLVSPTALLDSTLEPFTKDENTDVYAPNSKEHLNAIITNIVDNLDTEKNNLLILDDCSGFFNRNDELSKVVTFYRHRNLSIILTSQYYVNLPPVLRSNMTCLILFRLHNTAELQKILIEFSATFGHELETAYNNEFRGDVKYNFIVINFRDRTILSGFEKVIYS